MNEEMFSEWLGSPTTEYFMKYLRDSAKREAEDLSTTIRSGTVVVVEEQLAVVNTIRVLDRITQIDFNEIRGFYE